MRSSEGMLLLRYLYFDLRLSNCQIEGLYREVSEAVDSVVVTQAEWQLPVLTLRQSVE